MFALPPRQPRQRIALGSSARLSRLHLSGSQLGLNALQCDASDGVICGRAGLQRRLRGQSRKLSLPVMSRTEAEGIEVEAGLGELSLAGHQEGPARFSIGSPMNFRRRSPPSAAAAEARAQPDEVLRLEVEASEQVPAPEAAHQLASSSGAADKRTASSGHLACDEPAASSGLSCEHAVTSETSAESAAGCAASEEPAGAAAPAGDDSGTCAAGGDPEPGRGAAAAGGEDPAGVTSAQDSAGLNRNKVFAGNLPFSASKSRIWDLFEQFGKVTNVHLVKNPTNGKSRGFGFITFKDEASAKNALAADGSRCLYINKRQVRVSPAEPRAAAGPPRDGRRRRTRGAAPAGPCHVDRLPAELLHHVFSFLSVRQLVMMLRVCRRWRTAARSLLSRHRELDLLEYLPPSTGARLTDGVLRQLLIVMPGLRVLRTGGQARFCTWKALDIVAKHCRNLEEIDLDGFCINEESLKKLCINCPQLREVMLPSQYHFSESSVWVLLRHLPCLRSLNLKGSSRVTGKCFSLLPASLQRLSLAGCGGLRSENLRQVARCAQLRELDVSNVPSMEEADLALALAGCTQLERLALRRQPLAPERCLPPAGLPALRHLDVDFCENVTDATLRQLFQQLPELEELNIQGCLSVTEAGLAWLGRYKRLRVLNLSYLRCVSDAVLDGLHSSPLEQLMLAQGYHDPSTFTLPAVARVVLGCSSLTLLDLSAVENLTASLVEDLASQLPAERAVVINVGGTDLEGMSPAPDGPLRLQDTNTVPLHMRGMDELLWGGDYDDDDDYDFSDDYSDDNYPYFSDDDPYSCHFRMDDDEQSDDYDRFELM